MNADLHTRVFAKLIKKAASRFVVTPTDGIARQSIPADPAYPVVRVPLVGGGIEVPGADDHAPLRSALATFMINSNHRFAPFRDEPATWDSVDEALTASRSFFGDLLPRPAVTWKDPASDEALGRWARQGFSAHRLETARAENGGRAGERFTVQLDHMHALAVRPGLARYGGNLFLDEKGHPTRLVLGGKDVLPSHGKDWEFAKFTFRSSSLVGTTAFDHLGRCHYIVANSLYLASHRHLSLEHPLRHFLSPFHFRTGAINFGAVSSLVPEAGLVHRASGLTWASLAAIWKDLTCSYAFATLPDELRKRGVHPDDLGPDADVLYPYGADALAFWNALAAFVVDAFEHSPALKTVLGTRRDETQRWWDELSRGIPGIPALTEQALRDVVTLLFFTVSGFHNFVGTVTEYVADPTCTAGKLWPGVTMADRQSTMQLCLIASTTGFELPRVGGDFSHLMPDDAARDAARRFRASMTALSDEISRRNARRPQPFVAFDPGRVSLSVGV